MATISFANMFEKPAPVPTKVAAKAKNAEPAAKQVGIPTPKYKHAAKPLGSALVMFTGWKHGNGRIYYEDRPDVEEFNHSLRAGIVCGLSTDVKQKNGSSSGQFWNTTISLLKDPPVVKPTLARGCVNWDKISIPIPGVTADKTVFPELAKKCENINSIKFCGMGLKGLPLGIAAPLGSEFTAWLDFVWYAQMYKGAIYIEDDMSAKLGLLMKNNIIANVGDCTQDCPVYDPVTKTGQALIFVSKMPGGGLKTIKPGWIPFLPNVGGSKLFFGTSGIYNVAPNPKKMIDFELVTHTLNWYGLASYWALKHVPISSPELFEKAWRICKEKKSNVPLITVGFNDMFDAAPTVSKTDGFSKATWDYTCHPHQEWKGVVRPVEPIKKCLSERDDPKIIAHKGEEVIRAYTARRSWKHEGTVVKGYIWDTECLRCSRQMFVDPSYLYDCSLCEPVQIEPEDDHIDEGFIDNGSDDAADDDDSSDAPPIEEDNEKEKEVVKLTPVMVPAPVYAPVVEVVHVAASPAKKTLSVSSTSAKPAPPSVVASVSANAPTDVPVSKGKAPNKVKGLSWQAPNSLPANPLKVGNGVPNVKKVEWIDVPGGKIPLLTCDKMEYDINVTPGSGIAPNAVTSTISDFSYGVAASIRQGNKKWAAKNRTYAICRGTRAVEMIVQDLKPGFQVRVGTVMFHFKERKQIDRLVAYLYSRLEG